MSLPHIQLMSRRNCCLCEDARAVVAAAAKQGLCSWETVNVDHDKTLLVRYGMDVPVLLLNGQELCRHRVTADTLQTVLGGLSAGIAA